MMLGTPHGARRRLIRGLPNVEERPIAGVENTDQRQGEAKREVDAWDPHGGSNVEVTRANEGATPAPQEARPRQASGPTIG